MAVIYDDDIAPAVEPGRPKGKLVYDAAPVTAPPAAAVAPPEASSGAAPSGPPQSLDEAIAQGHTSSNPLIRGGANLADTIQRSPLTGVAEHVLAAGGNTVGKILAGGSGLIHQGLNAVGLTGGDPRDTVDAVRGATNYTPQTQGARDVSALGATVAKPFQAAAAPVDKAIANAGPGVSTFVPAASEAIQDVASILPFGQAARASKAASVVEGAAKPSVADPIGTVRGAGYVMRPSDVRATGAPAPGLVREALTSSAGNAKSAALTNQKLTTRLAGEDMGKPNATQLTDADYDKYRTNGPGKVYDATADALSNTSKEGKLASDSDAVSALKNLAANRDAATALPPKVVDPVNKIAKKIESGNYTGQDWRKDISWLRANGGRDAADELESMAERTLAAGGNTPQVQAFQQARADFAKSYDYQRATATRGQVDAQHLAALDAKYPGMLTGNAKIIATAGRHLPDVTKVPGGGVADLTTSGGHGTTGIVSRAGQLAGSALKKLPGMDPLSEGFQSRNFGRQMTPDERTYVPSFGQKGPGPSPFAPRLDLTPPPGPVENPTQLGMSLAQGRPPAAPLALTAPEGAIGEPPTRQLGMDLAQGRPAAPQLDLAPPSGHVGVNPVQEQIPLLPPMKRLGDILAPADERRLKRLMGRREEAATDSQTTKPFSKGR
jgi:hypothetical protein